MRVCTRAVSAGVTEGARAAPNFVVCLHLSPRLLSRIPVVMLTAHATSDNTIGAMRLGAFEHLTKPVGRSDIAALLERAVAPAARTQRRHAAARGADGREGGTGRFSLAQGATSLAVGTGARLSNLTSGFIVDRFGFAAGFLALAAVAAVAFVGFALFMPETGRHEEPTALPKGQRGSRAPGRGVTALD